MVTLNNFLGYKRKNSIPVTAIRPRRSLLRDNPIVLRGCIDDESIDLVYLDPPFNSQASYNVLFRGTAGEKSRAQIEAFEDTWRWGDEAELAFDGVMTGGNSGTLVAPSDWAPEC
jgi:adenine specific DNA methylase Mod